MADIVVPQNNPPVTAFGFGSVLSDAWDLGLSTFRRWVDDELGAEVPLAQEAQRDQMRQAAAEAPAAHATAVQGFNFSIYTLLLVGGAAVLVLMLLRR